MMVWLAGLVVLAVGGAHVAPAVGNARPLLAVDTSWVPPLTVGIRAPAFLPEATDRALVRRPWCDFGRHAQRRAKGLPGMDAVFRRPSGESRQALAVIRERIVTPDDYKTRSQAEKDLTTLLKTMDGPALYKTLSQDENRDVLAIATRAAVPIVAQHPRLAAFVTGMLAAPDPELALAAMELHLAAACDTPVQYGMDGFTHPSEAVQMSTLHRVWELSQKFEDLRLPNRVLQWVIEGRGTPRSRVTAVRIAAMLGSQSAFNAAQTLLADKNDAVAAEALVIVAQLQPNLAEARIPKWLRDKSPVKRAAAVRAMMAAMPDRQDLVDKWLMPLAHDTAVVPDLYGINGGPRTVADLVAEALRYAAVQ